MSRRRSLSTVLAVASVVLLGVPVSVDALKFTGVGSAYEPTNLRGVGSVCSPSGNQSRTVSTSEPKYVAVSRAHLATACGRCVQVDWQSSLHETLKVVGQCANCGTADLSFSADVYSRITGARDAGDHQESVKITWQFVDCPKQQQGTTVSPTNNSTSANVPPSPSPQNAIAHANATAAPSPLYQSPRAAEAASRAPYITDSTNTTVTTESNAKPTKDASTPSLHSNTSSNSTESAACPPPDAANSTNRSMSAEYKLLCDEDKPNTTTNNITAKTTQPTSPTQAPAKYSPSPTATISNKVPTAAPVEKIVAYDSDASKSPAATLVVDAKSMKVVATVNIAVSTLTTTRAPDKSKGETLTNANEVSVKSTQFSSTSTTETTKMTPAAVSTPATPSLASVPAPAPAAQRIAPLPANDEEEEYVSSAGSSTSSDSKKKISTSGDTTSSSRIFDDSTLSGKRHEALLKNPFFLGSVLLAVVGVVGAVAAYRAKEHKQHRHVHQNVAWCHYSQRVQSTSSRSAPGTPSPSGGLDDAYIVSNTTRHGGSSNYSPAIAIAVAAVLSPTSFDSETTRAQLGML